MVRGDFVGIIPKIKGIFKKPVSVQAESEKVTSIPAIDTPYGKKLDLNRQERIKLTQSLTQREKEAYLLLLEGYTLKETAGQLSISYSTANTYQTAVYRKLHVSSRAELIINYRDISSAKGD